MRAGATSPISGIVHALVVLAAILVLAPWLSWLPLSAMAALLLLVAWNMSEAHKVVDLVRRALKSRLLVLLVCLSLTVIFDMVIAITFGVILASLLFMREIAKMTRLHNPGGSQALCQQGCPPRPLSTRSAGHCSLPPPSGSLTVACPGEGPQGVDPANGGGLHPGCWRSPPPSAVRKTWPGGVRLKVAGAISSPSRPGQAKVRPVAGELEFCTARWKGDSRRTFARSG